MLPRCLSGTSPQYLNWNVVMMSQEDEMTVSHQYISTMSQIGQMKQPATSQWYITKTSQWFEIMAVHWYATIASPVTFK